MAKLENWRDSIDMNQNAIETTKAERMSVRQTAENGEENLNSLLKA